jgi:hypothetical protein
MRIKNWQAVHAANAFTVTVCAEFNGLIGGTVSSFSVALSADIQF